MVILKIKLDEQKLMKLVYEEIEKTIDIKKFTVSSSPTYSQNGFIEVWIEPKETESI